MAADFNIILRLREQALRRPRATALAVPATPPGAGKTSGAREGTGCGPGLETLTFAELDARSRACAAWFAGRGLGPGHTVLLLDPPGLRFYVLFLGLIRIGARVMLVDPGVGLRHTLACLRSASPTAFVGTPKAHLLRLCPPLWGVRAFCSGAALPFAPAVRCEGSGGVPDYPARADDPALLTFTSGSTGRPKGLIRSHGFLLRQADCLARLMPANPDSPHGEAELCTLPVFTLANLGQGVTTLLPGADLAALPAAMAACGVNRLLAAPDFCDRLLDVAASDPDAGACFRRLRHIRTGGGPVFPNLLDRLGALAPEADIATLYGSTEAEPIALMRGLSPADRARVAGGEGLPAGWPVPDLTLRIIADQGGRPLPPLPPEAFVALCLPPGATGEIVVTGPLVQKGYLNPADDASTKFRVRDQAGGETVWHRTGDAGSLDQDGRLWLHGRCSARTGKGGEAFYPFRAEAAAATLPGVRRAAWVEVNGQNILVLDSPALASRDAARLRALFPGLDRIVYAADMPGGIPMDKRHHSKVLYPDLARRLRGRV